MLCWSCFPTLIYGPQKTRPVVIVQGSNIGTGLPQHVVAMITSNLGRANHPSRVLIRRGTPEGQQAGLLTDSVVMTDNLATIAAAEMTRRIGYLEMAAVDIALRYTLGL